MRKLTYINSIAYYCIILVKPAIGANSLKVKRHKIRKELNKIDQKTIYDSLGEPKPNRYPSKSFYVTLFKSCFIIYWLPNKIKLWVRVWVWVLTHSILKIL